MIDNSNKNYSIASAIMFQIYSPGDTLFHLIYELCMGQFIVNLC